MNDEVRVGMTLPNLLPLSALLVSLSSLTAAAQEPPAPPPPATEPSPATPAAKPRRVKVTLKDGQELRGELAAETPEAVELSVAGARTNVARSTVQSMEDDTTSTVRADGQLWFQDPNRTRYFYGPSAMMLRQGEVTLSQKELLFTSVNFGVTDWLSLQAGAVVPAWLAGVNGFNFIGAVKVGKSLTEHWHVAGGVQALVLPLVGTGSAPIAGGFGFGSVTYGTGDAHVTLSAAKPFFLAQGSSGVGDALFTLSGDLRVARSVALVTENWVMPDFAAGQVLSLDAVGARLMGEHIAVDLGGVWMATSSQGLMTWVPVPWLDVTWNF